MCERERENFHNFILQASDVSTRYLMQSNVIAIPRDDCSRRAAIAGESFPLTTFCTAETKDAEKLSTCIGELGAGLICNNELRGVVTKTCDEDGSATQFTESALHFNWIFLSHADESLKIVDNEYLRKFVLSVLDFVAYYIGGDKIADDFEFVKFLF